MTALNEKDAGLVSELNDAITGTFEYDPESRGYYDTPLTILLRRAASRISELEAENARLREVLHETEMRAIRAALRGSGHVS